MRREESSPSGPRLMGVKAVSAYGSPSSATSRSSARVVSEASSTSSLAISGFFLRRRPVFLRRSSDWYSSSSSSEDAERGSATLEALDDLELSERGETVGGGETELPRLRKSKVAMARRGERKEDAAVGLGRGKEQDGRGQRGATKERRDAAESASIRLRKR